MYKIVFTVEWGSRNGYFALKYLPNYNFDGHIEIENGKILNVERINYKKDLWGPFVFSKHFEPYAKTEWRSRIQNWFDGIRVTSEVEDYTVIKIITNLGIAQFTPLQLKIKGHLVQHVADKYSMAIIHTEIDNSDWWLVKKEPDEIRLLADNFSGERKMLFGVQGVVIGPGNAIQGKFSMNFKKPSLELDKAAVKFYVRFLINGDVDKEQRIQGIPRFSVLVNGTIIHQNQKFNAFWDYNSQFLEETLDILSTDTFIDGENSVEIVNSDPKLCVFIQMLRFIPILQPHMEIVSCPKWVIVGVPFCISFRSTQSTVIDLEYNNEILELAMPGGRMDTSHRADRSGCGIVKGQSAVWEGKHEFFFVAKKAFRNAEICLIDIWNNIKTTALINELWDVEREINIMKTGVEIKCDVPSEYESLLQRVINEQMGNLIAFREYHGHNLHYSKLWDIAASCRKYGLYTDAIMTTAQHAIASASAEYCFCNGPHEDSGIFYSAEMAKNLSISLRDAEECSINELRASAIRNKIPGVPVALGDASGGSKYAYMAGFDIIRHETFIGHQMLILANARGSARAYGKKVWGAHVASQHNALPELDDGLRRFWLGMYLPWLYGANFVFEEDSIFANNKYIRMVNGDYMTLRKAEICSEFHKYTQTHPRKGEPQVDIAIIQGRFAAPFNGISTVNSPFSDEYQNEDGPIWGLHGSRKWEWGYRQSEKGYHLLELLSPKIYLNPLNQDAKRVRKFFSANPRGEYDLLPIEADNAVFSKYKLALMLNWHTMEYHTKHQNKGCYNDYDKLYHYVKAGGTLFISVAQLTTRADRELLLDMADMRIIYDGKVAALFGVDITGRSDTIFSGAVGRNDFSMVDFDRQLDLLRIPNNSLDEDGTCYLSQVKLVTAEVVVEDKVSGRPLVVRNRIGNGFAYLLCTYAFPGHESLRIFIPNLITALIECHIHKDVFVSDMSDTIYWSDWKNGDSAGKLYLLNTDWTSQRNKCTVMVHAGGSEFECDVFEGEVREISYDKNVVLFTQGSRENITMIHREYNKTLYELSGFGKAVLFLIASKDVNLTLIDKTMKYTASNKPYQIEVDFCELCENKIPVMLRW